MMVHKRPIQGIIMTQSPQILPIGTQVVTHGNVPNMNGEVLFTAGAVGVIIKSPVDATHAYRVRLLDSTEISLKRNQFSVRKEYQNLTTPETYLADEDLYQYVVYRCVVGSRAYGLDHENSDTDLRGFYLPPSALQWSLYGVSEQLERNEECYWEVQKFLVLALKANPNLLECLYSPIVKLVTPIAQELLDIRHIFVSKLIYQTYNGYVMSQFNKLQKDIQNYGEYRWKHAMHLIRLLLSGIEALNSGEIVVRVPEEHRTRLMAIRYEEVAWEEVNTWRMSLHKTFESAYQTTRLPDRPNYEMANAYLLKARQSVAC
jgi:uncharacterized protein